jgi:putative ABC transport system permease protein
MISTYQYVLLSPTETENENAEKFCVSELNTTDEKYMIDEISIFGIEDDSSYVSAEIPDGKVIVSESILKKFGLKTGDTLTLKAKYEDKTYDFTIGGSYSYDAGLAVFMTRNMYLDTFDKSEDYFNGYFTNEKLTDIDDSMIASIITKDDMTKVSKQLLVSMGENMKIFTFFGNIMFLLLMYLLTKQIIEKNSQSISMTKILGFTDGEIGGLYIAANSIVVVISLLLAVPVTDKLLRLAFSSYLYTEMTGYIPYMVTNGCFIKMILMGIGCYIVTALLQLYKIKKIPKSDALKNVE